MSTKTIRHTIKCSTTDEFISSFVDLYSCIAATPNQKLTDTEKTLFVEIVKAINDGHNPSTRDMLDRMEKAGSPMSDKNYYFYRNSLENKLWIVRQKKTMHIPPLFHFNNTSLDLEIKLRNGEV